MNKLTEQVFNQMPWGIFTSPDVTSLFPGSEHRRFGLIKRAIAKGEIIHIRRGLYCLAPKYQKRRVNLYALAQHVYGPSYISLESALSWHGWIPEAVHTVTSVSLKKSKEYRTPLGVFSYNRIPQAVLYTDVQRITDEAGNAFPMASALKALADYVYIYKKDWIGIDPVATSLRIATEEFEQVTGDTLDVLVHNYSNARTRQFLEGLRKDLKL